MVVLRTISFVFLLYLAAGHLALAATKVALVVGQSSYTHVPALANPRNDATAIAEALRKLGFEVTLATDMTRDSMWKALRSFSKAVDRAEVALFYYAGHGIQKDGQNFLIPVDAPIEDEIDLMQSTISLDQFMSPLQDRRRTNLVFLDACRNNPLAAKRGLRGGSSNDGLAPVRGQGGTLISYATDPNKAALDGVGSNSPFTQAILETIATPGQEIREMMVSVRQRVLDLTSYTQRPWTEDGLERRFYFAPEAVTPAEPPEAQPPRVSERDDFIMWAAIQQSNKRSEFELFIQLFPNSPLVPLARARLAAWRESTEPANLALATEPQSRTSDPTAGAAVKVMAPALAPRIAPSALVPRKPGEVFRDCDLCPELVAVPPGQFQQGSPQSEPGRYADEGPQRVVSISTPLALARFEVTFADWDACVAQGGCTHRPSDEGWGRGSLPVVNVNHDDATAYARWLADVSGQAYRLPSEAEWEYAARAGSLGHTPWSISAYDACALANTHDLSSKKVNAIMWPSQACDDEHPKTAPVGSFRPNGFGLYDMIGNVWEWTADCYAPSYDAVPDDGSPNVARACSAYSLRGGGWRDRLDKERFAVRAKAPAYSRTSTDGFRLVRTLTEGLDDGTTGPVAHK